MGSNLSFKQALVSNEATIMSVPTKDKQSISIGGNLANSCELPIG